MSIKIFGGLLVGMIAITSMAKAQTRTPVINHREHNQERRINQGVRSGQLTRKETKNVRGDERSIRAQKQADKASGKVTAADRTQLRHEENKTSRTIYRDKHNDKVRQ
jgi:hypothetical protein